MPDDPFKECFTEIHDKLYSMVVDLYPAAVNGEAFSWAKENRRPLYDAWAQAAGEIDDLWEKTSTEVFKKAVYAWAKAVLAIYKAFHQFKIDNCRLITSPNNPHNHPGWTMAEEPKQGGLF